MDLNRNITGCAADIKAEVLTSIYHFHNFAFRASSTKTWPKLTIKIRVTKARIMKLGVAHAYNSISQGAKAGGCAKFKASLGYIAKCEASQEDTVRLCIRKEKQRL